MNRTLEHVEYVENEDAEPLEKLLFLAFLSVTVMFMWRLLKIAQERV